ncbi:MAG: ABC transporter permease [Candidatus Hodarchaeota archaeon]
MNILLKKAVKDFRNLGWRSYLIIMTIILSLGGGLGLYYATQAAIPMMDLYFDDVDHADYTYQLSDDTWITQAQLDGLEYLDEVDDYTGRLFWTTSMTLPGQDEKKYVLLVGLDSRIEEPEVYNYNIQLGENFDKNENNTAVIDSLFAEKNDIDIGDEIEIDGLNNAEINILGICSAPEFVVMTSNPEYLFPIEGSMALIFIAKDSLKNYIIEYFIAINNTSPEDYTDLINYYKQVDYNNIAVTFKDDVSDGHDELKEYLSVICGLNIEKSEKFEDSYAYSLMKADVEDTGEIMMILLIFMALLGGIIVFVIFNRYVNRQKQQIGVLLGLGYTRKDILKYFLFNVFVISVISIPIGIIVGFGLGYLMLSVMLAEMANLSVLDFPFIFLPGVMYLGLIIGTLLVFFSTYFSIRKINKMVIAELIYEQTEVTRKIKKVKEPKKSRKITKRLVFRNLFKNPKRFAFTIIAMTFSLLIISSTESLLDSMYYNIDRTYATEESTVESSETWDLNVIFQTSVNLSMKNNVIEQIEKIKGVDDIKVYCKGVVLAKAKGDKDDQNLNLLGIDIANSKFHQFSWYGDKHDNSPPEDDDEIVISSVHAHKLDKEVGDKLTIKNAANQEFKFKIVGVHSELVVTPYVTLEAGKNIFYNGLNFIDGIYIILDGDVDKDDIIEEIYDLSNIEVIFDAEEMNEKAIEFINNYSAVLYVIIFYTLLVSFFIVFYNSVMNIYDKNYEYGILRSLGYSKMSVFRIILTENILQGIIPIILAIAFTYPLTLQMGQVYAENFALEIIIGITAIIMITIPPLILYILGSFIGLRTVYKQNLYEQVQTRFVG